MIVGLSHVTINSIDINKMRHKYLDDDWNEIFFARDIYNHPAKKSLLNHYEELHQLCILKKNGRNTVELVQHGSQEFAENNVYRNNWDGSIEIQCCSYESSLAFWCKGMGFVEDGGFLVYSSPIPEWNSKLKLSETNAKPISKLDNIGTSCLAFFSTDIGADISQLKAANATATDIMTLRINNKNLRICMLQAPSSEIVELIEIE